MENEIILYKTDDMFARLKVIVKNDNVWLNRQQISILFNRDIKTIGKHIANVLKEELKDVSVVAKFATTALDGKKYQVEHYNLDMIISVGYRVKSQRGIQFRIWANGILKEYLLKGYSYNRRMNTIEDNVHTLFERLNGIEFQIDSNLLPKQGVFFEGQIFDAYKFVNDLIRKANKSLVLIDNYIDDSVLMMLTKRKKGVSVHIYTKNISKQLNLDLNKHNAQYPKITIEKFNLTHDRFLIIDHKEIYHIGASLKDLGKKWFAFSLFDSDAVEMLNKLENTNI